MNGLDPVERHEINGIPSLQRAGTHILISSHILDELQSLCGAFLMLNWGRALASGSQAAIRSEIQHWPEQVVVRTSRPEVVAATLGQAGLLRGYLLETDRVLLWLRDPAALRHLDGDAGGV
jgi:ABC-2 type transport system ATP-binding protein